MPRHRRRRLAPRAQRVRRRRDSLHDRQTQQARRRLQDHQPLRRQGRHLQDQARRGDADDRRRSSCGPGDQQPRRGQPPEPGPAVRVRAELHRRQGGGADAGDGRRYGIRLYGGVPRHGIAGPSRLDAREPRRGDHRGARRRDQVRQGADLHPPAAVLRQRVAGEACAGVRELRRGEGEVRRDRGAPRPRHELLHEAPPRAVVEDVSALRQAPVHRWRPHQEQPRRAHQHRAPLDHADPPRRAGTPEPADSKRPRRAEAFPAPLRYRRRVPRGRDRRAADASGSLLQRTHRAPRLRLHPPGGRPQGPAGIRRPQARSHRRRRRGTCHERNCGDDPR